MSSVVKLAIRSHAKASERYIDVIFNFKDGIILETSVPIEYRRTGTDIPDEDIDEYLENVRLEIAFSNWSSWRKEQASFWDEKPNAGITKSFFDILAEKFQWVCATCTLPKNPNFARRGCYPIINFQK